MTTRSSLQAIASRFHELRRESISQAFRLLAETHVEPAGYDGVPPGEFAASVYQLTAQQARPRCGRSGPPASRAANAVGLGRHPGYRWRRTSNHGAQRSTTTATSEEP